MGLERTAQLAVLDGESPELWTPLGLSFSAFKGMCELDVEWKSPQLVCSRVRWEVLPHSPQVLFERTNWDSVVGALVDVEGRDIQRRHEQLCKILGRTKREKKPSLVKSARYHLIVLSNGPPLSQREQLIEALDLQAVGHLGRPYVAPADTIGSGEALKLKLAFMGREIMARLTENDGQTDA